MVPRFGLLEDRQERVWHFCKFFKIYFKVLEGLCITDVEANSETCAYFRETHCSNVLTVVLASDHFRSDEYLVVAIVPRVIRLVTLHAVCLVDVCAV